ncbi:inactive N-acetylated-alpha-linked acidic dipeptidase-like protein 2 [Bombina bombina]|uniref:inactive N-acetylated-alpha-linked acidic dipeptidase-like protein 2 n=1 Tax=Bombina bombina TaxID=8345 RepID=UPI00235A7489|nr:inactive N-acetylated-alpha-linked acidic dipeptidase-like protein 2 [Bombina bombina]
MDEKESNSTSMSQQGNHMSYHKTETHFSYVESDEIPSTAAELEWDMETELEEISTDPFQPDGFTQQHDKSSPEFSNIIASSQASFSPKGRFQRLQEEPEYFSHYGDSVPKKTQQCFCRIIKMFCTFASVFILGILLGYFSKQNSCTSDSILSNGHSSSNEAKLIDEILDHITKENIEKHYRYFSEISVNKTNSDPAKEIAHLWTSIGLNEVELVNYSVLLDLPGSSPNTITMNNGQCYFPSGQQCDEETEKHPSQESLYSYAAFCAKGSLEGEMIDVQYGTLEDLQRVKQSNNVTNSIALLKLGVLPLLYKISLLEDFGFKGALIYIDPCDHPETADIDNKTFMVSLYNENPIDSNEFSRKDAKQWKERSSHTSLLVQPVAVNLLLKLFPPTEKNTRTEKCLRLKLPEIGNNKIRLMVQSISTYKNISNTIGILRGSVLPARTTPSISLFLEKTSMALLHRQGWPLS